MSERDMSHAQAQAGTKRSSAVEYYGGSPEKDSEGGNGHANPFREMEKKFQLHYDLLLSRDRNGKLRANRGRAGKFKERPTDLSEVLDFEKVDVGDSDNLRGLGLRHRVVTIAAGASGVSGVGTASVFTMDKRPGFFFIRGCLSEEDVEKLAGTLVSEYIEPPASSNHTKKYGHLKGLWKAAQEDLYLSETREGGDEQQRMRNWEWSTKESPASAQKLLGKLRWISLGPQFDWTNRVYKEDIPYRELPESLKHLAESLVKQLDIPVAYQADAALLNFYASKDTLGGHKDDAELDLSQPLVSMSLGCDAIFLLGHLTKEEEAPTPMFVRSGDIVVLSGRARSCYHGVPRIFAQSGNPGDRNSLCPSEKTDEGGLTVRSYLANHRINISIRMVRDGRRS